MSNVMMITGKHNTDKIDHLATDPIERDKFKGKTYSKINYFSIIVPAFVKEV